MTLETIMSVCTADAPDSDIKMAADLCDSNGMHLSLVVVGVAISPLAGEYAVTFSEVWMEERNIDLKDISKQVENARRILQASGVSFDIDTEYAEANWADDAIGLHAHYCDLVVLGNSVIKDGLASGPVLEGAIFRSARPVLLVPKGVIPSLKPANVLIAWDSRREAAQAVYDALHFIRHAKSVSITMVDPIASSRKNGDEPGADLATYLARHGAKVNVERLASGGRNVADVLRQHALDIGADMIVMGAYGHSRLKERVFGGVTRALIDNTPVPVLMAH